MVAHGVIENKATFSLFCCISNKVAAQRVLAAHVKPPIADALAIWWQQKHVATPDKSFSNFSPPDEIRTRGLVWSLSTPERNISSSTLLHYVHQQVFEYVCLLKVHSGLLTICYTLLQPKTTLW